MNHAQGFWMGIYVSLFTLTGMVADLNASPRFRVQLQLTHRYQLSEQSLNTDLFGKIDPTLRNPHLERWGLARELELQGLKVTQNAEGTFGVSAQGLLSTANGYLRPSGSSYLPLSQFPCTSDPLPTFATREGAELALSHASRAWAKIVSDEVESLSRRLALIQVQNASTAQIRGEDVFQSWKEELEKKWRDQLLQEVRKKEWSFYSQAALEQGVCSSLQKMPSRTGKGSIPSLKTVMEPLKGSPPQWNQILARAPARLWNGLFSVRVSLRIGEKSLNGRFLIDSTASQSVISPSWLESQGVYPAWLIIPQMDPERVSWSGLWNEEKPLSRFVKVDRVELSGFRLPIQKFLLSETEFFSPPENLGSCCDGVLGLDFLRMYPVEFQSQAPAEVRVWPREGFVWSADTPWIELSEGADGTLVSACQILSPSQKVNPSFSLSGVRWDTGIEAALQVHTPWQASIRNKEKAFSARSDQDLGFQIECDSRIWAQSLEPEFPSPPSGIAPQGPLAESYPAVSLGMSLLGRGNFTLDLPHGRIWWKESSLPLRPRTPNRSGLTVEFEQEEGERILKVQKVSPHSPAAALLRKGLKVGSVLLEVNATAADELDLWQVDDLLAGGKGPQVQLKWKNQKKIQSGVLEVSSPKKRKSS